MCRMWAHKQDYIEVYLAISSTWCSLLSKPPINYGCTKNSVHSCPKWHRERLFGREKVTRFSVFRRIVTISESQASRKYTNWEGYSFIAPFRNVRMFEWSFQFRSSMLIYATHLKQGTRLTAIEIECPILTASFSWLHC